jgi:hypothetical protein
MSIVMPVLALIASATGLLWTPGVPLNCWSQLIVILIGFKAVGLLGDALVEALAEVLAEGLLSLPFPPLHADNKNVKHTKAASRELTFTFRFIFRKPSLISFYLYTALLDREAYLVVDRLNL